MTTNQNQSIAWLPMNPLTQKFYYTYPDTTRNMRIVMSSPGLDKPYVWQVSKIETAQPIGVNKISLYQTEWNSNTDYVDKEAIAQGDLFAYYADYFIYEGEAEPEEDKTTPDKPMSQYEPVVLITTSNNILKVGGSFKKLEATVHADDKDITDSFINNWSFEWKATIDGVEAPSEFVTWSQGDSPNTMKIKLAKIRKYIGKTLSVTCTINGIVSDETVFNIGAV